MCTIRVDVAGCHAAAADLRRLDECEQARADGSARLADRKGGLDQLAGYACG